MKTIHVKLTLIEELLGTASADPELHAAFIASKAPDAKTSEEEVAALGVDAVVEKAKTIFPKENGKPFLYDYQIKGALKDSCSMLARVPGTKSSKLKAFKKVIDGLIFPQPRKIMLQLPAGATIGNCQRPLRAQTPQGERIALVHSESAPIGTTLTFDIMLLDEAHEPLLIEWLDYWKLRGLGQWRNASKGRATYQILGDGKA